MRALLCYKIHYYILLRMYLVSLTTELCYYLVTHSNTVARFLALVTMMVTKVDHGN